MDTRHTGYDDHDHDNDDRARLINGDEPDLDEPVDLFSSADLSLIFLV